jgi:hypothetical protein
MHCVRASNYSEADAVEQRKMVNSRVSGTKTKDRGLWTDIDFASVTSCV